ncbi:MAG TPA: NAD(P)/FAD-dependent oxidoreductase [Clostridiales bacterium]|nr:NAD(P)/FAD-dependent oxidoreductase [Clostridiales bacterium]
MVTKNKVVVIGGGAAGMMTAATAARRGLDVYLVEKNKRLGKKMLITGKGRCNITNNVDIEGMINNIPVNGKFLYSAFNAFSNWDMVSLLEKLGVPTKVERGGRIFPKSDRAADVVDALSKFVIKSGAKIVRDEVIDVVSRDNTIYYVLLKEGGKVYCDSVVVATGGLSYPKTGCTGDGYRFARSNGHTIVPTKPALVPLEVYEDWVKEVQGLSLKNVGVKIIDEGQNIIYEDFGEMLFTHFGVSGPVILSASSFIGDLKTNKYTLIIDLKPALSMEQLDKRVQRDFNKYSRKIFSNSLNDLLPKKLIPVVVELSGISPQKLVNQITKQERQNLVVLLKNMMLDIKGFRPIDEAIITSGGVSVQEIDPRTMESKIVKGLYFAGEVIDINGYTGGFNLQIAFSTGYLAGMSC